MADLRQLKRRLEAVGVLPPGSHNDHEGWRDCLTKLCSKYLGPESPQPKEDSEKLPLPTEVQLAALQVRVEERRKRVLDLDLDLSTLSKREEKMRRVAEDDPLLKKRSREDFVQCLRQVRGRIGSIQEEEFNDGLDLSGFVEKLKGVLDEVT